MRLDAGPLPAEVVGLTKPADLPELYRRRYRLKPDRRFLYACAEVDRLLSGEKTPSRLFLGFESNRWSLRLENEAVGTLSEIPPFAEAQELLDRWTRARIAKHKVVASERILPEVARLESDLTRGSTTQVLGALRVLNGLAAGSTSNHELVKAAARGTVWLAVQTLDELQLSDPLVGHALALFAIARAREPNCLPGEWALLVSLMGYETAAMEAARSLPSGDAVAAFANLDLNGLRNIAVSSSDPRAQYLYILRLALRGEPEKYWAAFRRTVWARAADLSSLRAGVLLHDHNTELACSQAVMFSAFLEVTDPGHAPRATVASLWGPEAWPEEVLMGVVEDMSQRSPSPAEGQTRAFEEAARRIAAGADGVALDSESVRAFYRAPFYSGLHSTARHLFDGLGSTPAADRYAKSIVNPAPGTAEELRRWIQDRVVMRSGGKRETSVRDFAGFRHIGVEPLYRVASTFSWNSDAGTDPENRRLLRNIIPALDSRPSNLGFARHLATSILGDPRLRDAYLAALGAAAPIGTGAGVTAAVFARDFDALSRIASDRREEMGNRVWALESLASRKQISPSVARARFAALMKEEPENMGALEACVRVLRGNEAYASATSVIQAWLAGRPTAQRDLRWARALVLQAEVLSDQKKWREAWTVIAPAVPTWKGDVLLDAAWILENRGDRDRAMKLARAALERYPEESSGYAAVSRVLWQQKNDTEAAELLAGSRRLKRNDWEGTIANSFSWVFAEADPGRAEAAFAALRECNVDPTFLAALARDVGRRGNHELALELLQQVPATASRVSGPSFPSARMIWIYDELVQTGGAAAAAEWLRREIENPYQLAIVAYEFERYDVLWGAIEDPSRIIKQDAFQLMRAAAFLIENSENDARRERLIQYFQTRPRTDWTVMGLFLLGKASEQELFAGAQGLQGRATVAWLMGVKAASEERFQAASDWFSVAVDTDQAAPPTAFSFLTLHRWMNTGSPKPRLLRTPDS